MICLFIFFLKELLSNVCSDYDSLVKILQTNIWQTGFLQEDRNHTAFFGEISLY